MAAWDDQILLLINQRHYDGQMLLLHRRIL